MKILLLLSILSSSMSFTLESKDITGFWAMPENKQGRTPIANLFEKDSQFYAIGFAFTDLGEGIKDVNNPTEELRDRLLKNVMIVNGVKIINNQLADGEIYNPDRGKYFYLKGVLSEDKNTITWKASIDKRGLFGATLVWTRVPNLDIYKEFEHSANELEKLIPSERQKK